MLGSKSRRSYFGVILLASALGVVAAGCNGNTDGGSGADDATNGNQYVSDGGAGAAISIDAPTEIAVGEEADFSVSLTDAAGVGIPDTRVFCESEKGIAIIEPSSGGVAFEHTSKNGHMSGVLGGLLPGSYMLECRAPEGFNLVARVHMKITGDVPPGFAGWPGAAGGNLGGGVIIVQDPDEGVQVAAIGFTEGGEVGFNIDTARNLDCNHDGAASSSDLEPWIANDYSIEVTNDSLEQITVETVTITVDDGRGVQIVDSGVNAQIASGSSGTVSGPFTEPVTATATPTKAFAGTAFALQDGTYNVSVTVEGHSLSGESISSTGTVAVRFANLDYCGG